MAKKKKANKKDLRGGKKPGPAAKQHIPQKVRNQIYRLAVSGQVSLRMVMERYSGEYPEVTKTQWKECIRLARQHFQEEKFRMGREALAEIFMNQKYVTDQLMADFDRAALPMKETTEKIEKDGSTTITIKTYMKDRSAMAKSLKDCLEMQAKLLGIFNPDFDQQEGQEIKVVNVAVTSEADIAKFETLGRRGDVDGFSQKVIEADYHRVERELNDSSD